jgi:hypothetical protein
MVASTLGIGNEPAQFSTYLFPLPQTSSTAHEEDLQAEADEAVEVPASKAAAPVEDPS